MSELLSFSGTAFLIADQARAVMLSALLDGRALPAGELAYASGVTPQTASAHLAKLLEGGLITVEREGRHRYYRLAGAHVAQALEYLAAIRPATSPRRKALSPEAKKLRFCRCCYDHLAGQVGVAIADALQRQGYMQAKAANLYEVTPAGIAWFAAIGIDVAAVAATRRGLARQCPDCTERQHHLAGALGARLMAQLCAAGWVRRRKASRVIDVTPKGCDGLKRQLGIDVASLAVLREGIAAARPTARQDAAPTAE